MQQTPHSRAHRILRPNRLAAFIAAVLLAGISPRLYAQVRLAVVDMQRALLETNQGRVARNQLKGLFQKRQVELDGRQTALKLLRDNLEKQQSTLDRETLQRRMQDYQKQFVDLQQNFLEYQQELAQREAELTKQIYVNLQGVIRQLGQQENYTAIFEQSGVVWSPTQLDRTDQVVQMYNQQFPAAAPSEAGGGAARAPAAAVTQPARPAPAPAGTQRAPVANPHPREENARPPR